MSSSAFPTVPSSNYGRQQDNQQNLKQFVSSSSVGQATWIYEGPPAGQRVITTAGAIKNVLIKGDLYVTGTIYNPSDENIKKDIDEISLIDTENILNLTPVEYKYIYDTKKTKHFGLIAQEVEHIYPELVSTNNKGFKNVNYIELIPLLLSKIKDMNNEINNLKHDMTELKEYILKI
jgi:hypothetical protein